MRSFVYRALRGWSILIFEAATTKDTKETTKLSQDLLLGEELRHLAKLVIAGRDEVFNREGFSSQDCLQRHRPASLHHRDHCEPRLGV